jgi:REP-associated tyrosine transposase
MPSRNVIKIDIPDSFYHVYARGHSRAEVFLDREDYATFLNLFKRYLSVEQQHDRIGVPYPHLFNKLELLCFCLATNHFHLLLYQRDERAMQTFMRGLMTSYSSYFNRKYGRSGALFETSYKASLITDPSYLEHITRYVHLNRKNWESSPYSSIDFYLGRRSAKWVRPERILNMFTDRDEYKNFVADYEANKQMLDELKYELANDII